MIQTVLEIALSMGIINAVIWCFRARVVYIKLRRLQKIEIHICKCLSFSNLLFFHALARDNYEISRAFAKRNNQREAISLSSQPFLPLAPLPLEYKAHSGEIHPYSQIMQSLHQESGNLREEILDTCEESGRGLDCDFLGWDYGTPYPQLDEDYQETMTLWTYSVMQSKYLELFDVIQEIVKCKHKSFQRSFSFLILVPAANRWFQRRSAPPNRERIYNESSKLRAEYADLRRRTGSDRLDLLLPTSA